LSFHTANALVSVIHLTLSFGRTFTIRLLEGVGIKHQDRPYESRRKNWTLNATKPLQRNIFIVHWLQINLSNWRPLRSSISQVRLPRLNSFCESILL